tara:strand:- start:580 stop:948 length:369 start_codon:yes stop_codon:yes gene_type:complete
MVICPRLIPYIKTYQIQNYSNYFERCSSNVIAAINASSNSPYISCINYHVVLNDYEKTITTLYENLKIRIINESIKQSKEKYINGDVNFLSQEIEHLVYDFCNNEISKYSRLASDILEYKIC